MTNREALDLYESIRYNLTHFKHKEAVDVAFASLVKQEDLARNSHDVATPVQSGWISVDDRLPEDNLPLDSDRVAIKVLTVTKHGKRRFVRELTRQRWEWRGVMRPWCWSKDAIGVTHWMPMPEPPEVEV